MSNNDYAQYVASETVSNQGYIAFNPYFQRDNGINLASSRITFTIEPREIYLVSYTINAAVSENGYLGVVPIYGNSAEYIYANFGIRAPGSPYASASGSFLLYVPLSIFLSFRVLTSDPDPVQAYGQVSFVKIAPL